MLKWVLISIGIIIVTQTILNFLDGLYSKWDRED